MGICDVFGVGDNLGDFASGIASPQSNAIRAASGLGSAQRFPI